MCGIFGFVGKKYNNAREDLLVMKDILNHRGPDHFDFFSLNINDQYSLNLGHVRLSIIDVSRAGNQPMHSKSGRFTIVFNGEIYNFLDIKKEIENTEPDIQWKGSSDTEVLLAGIETFGLQKCVEKLVGMFAISLWDNNLQNFFLIRDRIGEKPLYYGFQGEQLIFGSELKAFEVHSSFEKNLNIEAAVGFLQRSYVPQSFSIYQNIYKVIPGTILEFNLNSIETKVLPEPIVYWSLVDKINESEKNKYKGTYQEAKDKLEDLLIQAVKDQSIADVPLGAFLSGGVDSSLVCAILKNYVNSDLHTYTIAMPEPGQNESLHAEKVANCLGTIHTSKELNTEEIISRIDEIINYWDEPFADSSQIPTFFVSELAKKEVTVSLSGDGADEFLYGYVDHQIYKKYKKFVFISHLRLDIFVLKAMKFFGFGVNRIFKKIEILSYILGLFRRFKNLGDVHLKWHNKFWNSSLPLKSNILKESAIINESSLYSFENVGHYDALNYLPNDILVKVDRAAMAVSLESRAPFLDHRVLEFLITLPQDFLFKNGITKRIAKDILYKYVPREIIDRPKQGFSVPMSYWLKNDLKLWAEDIINSIPQESKFWDRKLIDTIWSEHQTDYRDHPEKIWNIVVLESFFKRKKLLHYDNKII